jgi:hypothetical protein
MQPNALQIKCKKSTTRFCPKMSINFTTELCRTKNINIYLNNYTYKMLENNFARAWASGILKKYFGLKTLKKNEDGIYKNQ